MLAAFDSEQNALQNRVVFLQKLLGEKKKQFPLRGTDFTRLFHATRQCNPHVLILINFRTPKSYWLQLRGVFDLLLPADDFFCYIIKRSFSLYWHLENVLIPVLYA